MRTSDNNGISGSCNSGRAFWLCLLVWNSSGWIFSTVKNTGQELGKNKHMIKLVLKICQGAEEGEL